MMISLVAYAPKEQKPENKTESFTGTARGFGGDVSVTIVVADGKITEVTAKGKDETPDVGGKALGELVSRIREAQSYEVDGVTGATITRGAVKEAAKAAMVEARKPFAAS